MLKPMLVLAALLLVGSWWEADGLGRSRAGGAVRQTAAAPAAAPIPPEAAAMVNPGKPSAEVLTRARKLYGYDCAVCHGERGDGKGELSASFKVRDWTDPATLKDMTDGELFYIIKNGRGQMTGEGDRAKTPDLWALVVITRSFAKKP